MEREAAEMESRLDDRRPVLAAKLRERFTPDMLLRASFRDVVYVLSPDEDYTTWVRPCMKGNP